MPGVRVIGIGHPDRGDDAAGLLVVHLMMREHPTSDLRTHTGDGISLMDQWDGADSVILVDAMDSCDPPGVVRRFEKPSALETVEFPHSTHRFGLAEAIQMAAQLGRLPPQWIVYGIAGRAFRLGDHISPGVEEAVHIVVQELEKQMYST